MRATRKNDVDLVTQLLANGADAKAANSMGQTALMIAAEHGSTQMVEILLPGSDAKASTKSGYTALIYAAESGSNKMVEILLPKSDAKATQTNGYTALIRRLMGSTDQADPSCFYFRIS